MRISGKTEFGLLAAILAVCFACVFVVSDHIGAIKPVVPESYEDEDLSLKGERLKGYAFGFEGLLADWYWMRSLQYIGKKFVKNSDKTIRLDDLSPLNPRLLYPLLDNAGTLDPQFIAVYNYGAMVLPAIDPEQAIAIVRKGIENNPGEWRLYHYLGFIYWRLERYEEAAEIYGQGAKIKGAAPFMSLMEAKLRSDAGSRDTARAIYRQIYEGAQDSQTRENARVRLLQMDSLDEQDSIREVLAQFKAEKGRCPSTWGEITPALARKVLPGGRGFRVDAEGRVVDPSDAPYLLNSKDGKCEVGLDREKTLIPLK